MIRDFFVNSVKDALKKAVNDKKLNIPEDVEINFMCEIPKNTEFGDYAVNVSMLSKYAKMAPPLIANIIKGGRRGKRKHSFRIRCWRHAACRIAKYGGSRIRRPAALPLEILFAQAVAVAHGFECVGGRLERPRLCGYVEVAPYGAAHLLPRYGAALHG